MNKFISMCVVVVLSMSLFACAKNKVIDNVEYESYGLINKDEVRNPKIHYKLVTGNVVWGIILSETIVAPVYLFGFSLYEPARIKTPEEIDN